MPDAAQADRIREMFDRIAGRYDHLNTLFSLGRDLAWRRRAAKLAGLRPGETALDLCTGTGKLARELLSYVIPNGRVVGVDFSSAMLARAQRTEPAIEFRYGDALGLPFSDGTMDAVTIAFGLRNLIDPDKALSEIFRVLRRGGRAVVLEFAPPERGWRARLYMTYLTRVIPAVAGLVAPGLRIAYCYLAESVQAFPSPTQVAQQMAAAGFREVEVQRMTFGAVALHVGTRPAG